MQRSTRTALFGIVLTSTLMMAAHAAAVEHPVFTMQGSHLLGKRNELRSPELAHQNLGLLGFMFQFDEGDHKPGYIGMIPALDGTADTNYKMVSSNERLTVAFSDDGDDPFDFRVRYAKAPLYGSRTRKIAETPFAGCQDACTIDIDGPPQAGDQFVLQGFRFGKGTNQPRFGDPRVFGEYSNVQRIAIKLHSDRTKLQIVFRDGTPGDKVSCSIAYSYLAKEHVDTFGTATAEKPKDTARQRLRADGAVKLIQGFDFNFTNGDHQLRAIGIDSNPSGFDVTYNDKNLDDPASLSIEYVSVKGTLPPAVVVRPAPPAPPRR